MHVVVSVAVAVHMSDLAESISAMSLFTMGVNGRMAVAVIDHQFVAVTFEMELGRDRRHIIGRGEFCEPTLVRRLPARGDDRQHAQDNQRDGHARRALVRHAACRRKS